MLNRIGNHIIKFGYRLLLFVAILWAFVAIGYGASLIDTLNTYGYVFVFCIVMWFISQTVRQFVKKVVYFLYHHWYWTLLVLVIYQCVIILSNSVLVMGDTRAIIENIRGISNGNYFSANPNNLLYGLYVKGLYHLVGLKYLVLVQELINVFILDTSIVVFAKVINKYCEKRVGAIYFSLSIGLIGLHPQFLSTYTDYWSYFTATFVCISVLKILTDQATRLDYIIFGFFIGIGYLIRPTILIYVIALFFALLLRTMIKGDKLVIVKFGKSLLAIGLGLLVFTSLITVVKKTELLPFKSGYEKNLAYYFDLGLTSTGAAHVELPPKARNENTPKEVFEPLIDKDIRARLEHYSLKQAMTKFKIAFQEGNLGWRIEQPLSFLKFQKNKVTSRLIESKTAQKMRNYLFFQGSNFANLDFFLQTMWVVMIVGIIYQLSSVLQSTNFSTLQLFLALSILGAVMYLMLFEAGRSRYLISFLPVLILLSAFGYQTFEEKINEFKYRIKPD
jgi:hypothetical protein